MGFLGAYQSSAKLAVDSEQSISATAGDLGVNATTLHGWVKKYYPDASVEKSPNADQGVQEELKRLRKENARLKQERDILKKAAAYFASETM